MKQTNKEQGFTLVELIVIITILAILGTIAFISLQGYSAQARDTTRVSDIQNIKTSLELFSLNTGKYPLPDSGTGVLYATELVWTQGTVGNTVSTNLSRNLNEKPTDPLTETEYTYSVIGSQTKYELLSIYESDLVSYDNNLLNQTNAANANYPKISGNYNGIFVKTPTYYIPLPSIITSADLSTGLTLTDGTVADQIITGGENNIAYGQEPAQTNGLPNFKISSFSGLISDKNDDNKELLAQVLIDAYSGTLLANEGIYKQIIETTGTTDLISLIDDVVLSSGTYTSTSGGDDNCEFDGNPVGHTESVTAYETASVTYGNTCNSEQRTCTDGDLSGTFTFTGCIVDGALNCLAGSKEGTNATYSYLVLNHGATTTGNGTKTLTHGTVAYTATISCTDGITGVSNEIAGTVTCTDGYTGITCEIAPTYYPGCDTPDITFGDYTIAGCNVGATAGTEYASCVDLATCTTARVGNYYQFGKSDTSWVNGNSGYSYDWKSPGGIDAGSANDWGISESEKTTATYSNQNSTDQAKMQGPCAIGYHIPTNAEWVGIHSAGGWLTNGANMQTALKLPYAGFRYRSDGTMGPQGSRGTYWSSSPNGTDGYRLDFDSSYIYPSSYDYRAYGFSVRCFKN